MRYWTPENGLQDKRTVEMGNQLHDYRITSNNNRGQFRLLFSHKKGAIIPGMYSPQNVPQFRIISGAVQGGGYFKFCSLEVVP